MPLHVRAEPRDVAPIVLLVGDPGRATRIAGRLEDARCYNDFRGLLGYTGMHDGIRLSVQTTGMGGPSAAIVVEELADLGAETVIRVGTCGAIGKDVRVLDTVVATGAVPLDGTTAGYMNGDPFAPVAAFSVTSALMRACEGDARPAHSGVLLTHDVFYRQAEDLTVWRERGVLAVEMEAATVFTVAALRGLRAGAACIVIDDPRDRGSWASDEELAGAMDVLVGRVLDAAVALARP